MNTDTSSGFKFFEYALGLSSSLVVLILWHYLHKYILNRSERKQDKIKLMDDLLNEFKIIEQVHPCQNYQRSLISEGPGLIIWGVRANNILFNPVHVEQSSSMRNTIINTLDSPETSFSSIYRPNAVFFICHDFPDPKDQNKNFKFYTNAIEHYYKTSPPIKRNKLPSFLQSKPTT